jgi:hypothetical protein
MALEHMGMVNNFLEMVKLLFKGVKQVICLNGGIMKPFEVQRKV